MHIILGSQSPRRKEILSFFNLEFEQMTSSFIEEEVIFKGDPIKYATEISKGKALDLHAKHPRSTILTADTVVYQEGIVYGKPLNKEEAFHILSKLQGSWHSVFTSLSLFHKYQYYSAVEETKVLFNPLTQHEIELYLQQMQWADKAGGYSIQTAGGLIVRKIDGCFYNVMGLPVNTLRSLLIHIGLDLWECIQKK